MTRELKFFVDSSKYYNFWFKRYRLTQHNFVNDFDKLHSNINNNNNKNRNKNKNKNKNDKENDDESLNMAKFEQACNIMSDLIKQSGKFAKENDMHTIACKLIGNALKILNNKESKQFNCVDLHKSSQCFATIRKKVDIRIVFNDLCNKYSGPIGTAISGKGKLIDACRGDDDGGTYLVMNTLDK